MDLSFIGWYILGFIACCIGILFVNPYYNATYAEVYSWLKYNAMDEGILAKDNSIDGNTY